MSATLTMVALTLTLGGYAPQQAGTAPLSPQLEARVQQLGKELRCAVCQGLSITDSPASMARAQLDKVRMLVSEGKSDQEVRDYFIARYGEWVLLSPPTHGIHGVVWFGPLALLLVGAWLIWRTVRSKPNARGPASAVGAPPPTATSVAGPSAPGANPYLDAVRAESDS